MELYAGIRIDSFELEATAEPASLVETGSGTSASMFSGTGQAESARYVDGTATVVVARGKTDPIEGKTAEMSSDGNALASTAVLESQMSAG